MLPTPLISDWSSSARLMPVRRRCSAAANAASSKAGVQRVRRDVRDRARQVRPARDEKQMAERPLVGEAQVGPVVGKREHGSHVRRQGASGVAHEQLAAHPQVCQQRILAHRQPEVLPAAARARDLAAGQGVREVGGSGQMAAHGPGVQHGDLVDGAAGHVLLQASPHHLNLG